MKRVTLAAFGVLCVLSLTAVAADKPAPPDASPATPGAPNKLIVHEWGTFTGFVGSDGDHLPFRADVGADLPSFVLTRTEQADRLDPGLNAKWIDALTKDETVALQRMETPVVYFYTDAPQDVEARVEFPQGMLTEFYPPVRSMTPAVDLKAGRAVLSGTSLDWGRIRITPAAAGITANVPKVEGDSHYAHARETDAAIVRFSDRPGEAHDEHFLFYRGLGNFKLPVVLTAAGGDRFTLHNQSGAPIASAFLIRVEGKRIRFTTYRNIGRRQDMALTSTQDWSTAAELGESVVNALVAEGLYEKEARAMVKTWETTWFAAEGTGTRLLYTLPRPVTDTLLPLHISPTPHEMVRVLVGRIDVLTPEQEAKLGTLFAKIRAPDALSPADARAVKALGRFMTPAIGRAAQLEARKVVRAVNAVDLTAAGG